MGLPPPPDADESPPVTEPTAGVVLIGSSILRLWPAAALREALGPELAAAGIINNAFGGSVTEEVLRAAPAKVVRLRPQVVVYYAGSNDVYAGLPPGVPIANFQAFAALVLRALPRAAIVYVSVILSPAQALSGRAAAVAAVNEGVAAFAAAEPRVTFLDVNGIFRAGDPGLFDPGDLHHLTARAYGELGALLRPPVERLWREACAGAPPPPPAA